MNELNDDRMLRRTETCPVGKDPCPTSTGRRRSLMSSGECGPGKSVCEPALTGESLKMGEPVGHHVL